MYYFDEKLCKTAVELLQNSKDLVGIANDVQKINRVLNCPALFSPHDMRNLNSEINEKYPEIGVFKIIADSINWKVSSNVYYQQNTVIEVEELKFDRFYLYALALKKSGKIAKYIDFFDKKRIVH